MTAPRLIQNAVPFEAVDEALDAPYSDSSQTERRDSALPDANSRAPMPSVLEGLQRQLATPRTPLLPSMDLFQSVPFPQQKSIVDTLPPLESVPPPAPFPSEPPPARPSVVPPIRQPRSHPPPGIYSAPSRQSNPPPVSDNVFERFSSAPPPPDSIQPPEPFSSAPPPGSSNRVARRVSNNPPAAFAPTALHSHSPEERRREAATIPADARTVSRSQPPPYDPSQPLPSLRVPSFAPQAFDDDPIRRHENRRLGSVAFVLLVGLLVVTGAIMGVNYAANGTREATRNENARVDPVNASRLKLERLAPNAVVSPTAHPPAEVAAEAHDAPATTGIDSSPRTTNDKTSNPSAPTDLQSPWSKSGQSAGKSKPTSPSNTPAKPSSRKRLDPKSIDTETPLIMD